MTLLDDYISYYIQQLSIKFTNYTYLVFLFLPDYFFNILNFIYLLSKIDFFLLHY